MSNENSTTENNDKEDRTPIMSIVKEQFEQKVDAAQSSAVVDRVVDDLVEKEVARRTKLVHDGYVQIQAAQEKLDKLVAALDKAVYDADYSALQKLSK